MEVCRKVRKNVINSKQIYSLQHIFKVFETTMYLIGAQNNQQNRGIQLIQFAVRM